jgi:hypothetical protein
MTEKVTEKVRPLATTHKAHDALVFLTAAWSGFFVMGIELLGARLLSPYFGTGIFVWGGVITVFMSCLAAGYLIGGRLSSKAPSIRVLGLLMLMEACFAVPVISIGDSVMDLISNQIDDARYGSLIGSMIVFGPTTVISGMISPYAVRLLVKDVQDAGRSAGALYFVSTFGSAGGTILTSFYLVMHFEINQIILGFIAISTAIGASSIYFESVEKRGGKAVQPT